MFCAIFILILSLGIGHGFHYHNFSQGTFKDDKYDLTTNKEIRVPTKIDIQNHNQAQVNLKISEDGISPGQACVFYQKDDLGYKVLGGGWIKN